MVNRPARRKILRHLRKLSPAALDALSQEERDERKLARQWCGWAAFTILMVVASLIWWTFLISSSHAEAVDLSSIRFEPSISLGTLVHLFVFLGGFTLVMFKAIRAFDRRIGKLEQRIGNGDETPLSGRIAVVQSQQETMQAEQKRISRWIEATMERRAHSGSGKD